jgi:hypothetical protein
MEQPLPSNDRDVGVRVFRTQSHRGSWEEDIDTTGINSGAGRSVAATPDSTSPSRLESSHLA